jgi:hypothetical protein
VPLLTRLASVVLIVVADTASKQAKKSWSSQRERAELSNRSTRFGELGQAGIGTLPEIQEAFVLLQSRLLVSRALEQTRDF